MATATEDRPLVAPPSVLGAFLARLRHPDTRRGTIFASVAIAVATGGAIFWSGRRYNAGLADGIRAARRAQEEEAYEE